MRSIPWRPFALIFTGGLVGSALRVGVDEVFAVGTTGFPLRIAVVNLVGSFTLGLFLARRDRAVSRPASTQFWAIGVLGSFTTFSAFSADVFDLMSSGGVDLAIGYIALSLPGGLLVAMAGQRVGAIR